MSIVIDELSFSYDKKPVIDKISFEAKNGELISVLGPNGTGKSTLFKCIIGTLSGYSGSISIDGKEAAAMSAVELAKKIAYIPQIHYSSFNYTAADMVLMGTANTVHGFSSPKNEEIERMNNAFEKLGISNLKNRSFPSLSGGEQQLVLMARAMAQNVHIWILDEPCASLDFGNQIRVQKQLKALAKEGYTIIQSTHNPDQTFMFSDKVVALKGGKIIASGTAAEVINKETVSKLYEIETDVESIHDDKIRVCIPKFI